MVKKKKRSGAIASTKTLKSRKEAADDLLKRARSTAEDGDFDSAEALYLEALKADNNSTEALDELAELYFDLQLFENVLILLKKSIAIRPRDNFNKYMLLGQLLDPTESIEAFKYGIDLLQEELKRLEGVPGHEDTPEFAMLRSKLSSAYVSCAELFLQDPLCNLDDAPLQCEEFLRRSIEAVPDNPEALLGMADLRIRESKTNEGIIYLKNSVDRWMTNPMNEDTVDSIASTTNADLSLTSPAFRLQTAKLALEVKEVLLSIDVISTVVKEVQDDIEIWYIYALAILSSDSIDEERRADAIHALVHARKLIEKEISENGSEADQAREFLLAIEDLQKIHKIDFVEPDD